MGLRAPHYAAIHDTQARIGFFEAISENYFGLGGPPLRHLDRVRERHPVVLHGVSLSIGGPADPERSYLERLRALVRRVRPAWISDHFCFCGAGGAHLHELLPLPYTSECVERVARRARLVQDYLEAPFALENTSSYLTYGASTLREWEFVSEVVERADCGLLLDVNNVYVSARNHGFEPREFLRGVPHERVLQIHLAGHTDATTHLLDTHSSPPSAAVLELYRETLARTGPVSTLLEWDADIPPWDEVLVELERLERARSAAIVTPRSSDTRDANTRDANSATPDSPRSAPLVINTLDDTLRWLGDAVRSPQSTDDGEAARHVAARAPLSASQHVEIYREQYWLRHVEALREDFPGLLGLLGDARFTTLVHDYLDARPPRSPSLRDLGRELPEHLANLTSAEPGWHDMARLEWAYVEAFDAEDSAPFDFAILARLAPDEWAEARLRLAPSLRLLTLEYPVAEQRRALLAGHPPPASERRPERRAVHRDVGGDLGDRPLAPAAALLLELLSQGQRLGEACERVVAELPEAAEVFDRELAGWFRDFARLGWIVAVEVPRRAHGRGPRDVDANSQ